MNIQELERQFVEMVTNHQQTIYKVCYMYATDDYTLDELYQETIINLWKGYAHFREESKVSTWIYRIAMNTCISYFRKSASRPQTIPISFDLEKTISSDKIENYYGFEKPISGEKLIENGINQYINYEEYKVLLSKVEKIY